jgi:hypothetical protein
MSMARSRRSARSRLAAPLLLAAYVSAAQFPAGTEIPIRLRTKVSTQSSCVGDAVDGAVIGGPLSGAMVHGKVDKVAQSAKGDERSMLAVRFDEIESGGGKTKLAAQIAGVENAREQVDEQGQIQGILASETITGKLDAGINKVAERYSGLADVLGAVKGAVFKSAESDITYDAGVELVLKLTAPLELTPPARTKLTAIDGRDVLTALIAREPFLTVAQNPPKPSDITNLLLVGTEDQVRRAFSEAGWHTAAELSARAKFETVRAVAENRGYSEAPVSVLLLDGKPPDIVYQKVTNTFARRHHLRVWRRPATFQGRPVWAVAATHDIGISFSEENRTFIHLIDSKIDRERTKVLDDLVFTGRVESAELVERPKVPVKSQNATGDALETDGKIEVLVFGKE